MSGPDNTPVVVLKNYEPELLYIRAEHFNMHMNGSCFPNCWKVSSLVAVFKNVSGSPRQKLPCLLLFFPWSYGFEKLVNYRVVDHFEKCGFFSLRLAELVQLPCFPGRSACYFNKLHDFSVSVCMSHSFITIRFTAESLILTNDNRLIFDKHDKNHCDFWKSLCTLQQFRTTLICSWFVVALVPDKGGLKAWVSFLLLKHFLKLCTH